MPSDRPRPLAPPLECLRFFEAAARHESFSKAADELGVTPSAVGHRIRILEEHIGERLFERIGRSGVALTFRGKAWRGEVGRILADIQELVERNRERAPVPRLRVFAVESIAEGWLLPRLARFSALRDDIAVELETDHVGVDPNRHDFDAWITFAGDARAPGPESARHETLFEESLVPVCSPALLKSRGRPRDPGELHRWPLIYHLEWPGDWPRWFAAQGHPPPDLSQASRFRLCGLIVQAAVEGMGAAIARPSLIRSEIECGNLVTVFRQQTDAFESYSLITTSAGRRKPEVEAFREWLLAEATG